MPYKILPACIACGACEAGCEHDAVIEHTDGTYTIDKDKCTDCGNCKDVCPIPSCLVYVPREEGET